MKLHMAIAERGNTKKHGEGCSAMPQPEDRYGRLLEWPHKVMTISNIVMYPNATLKLLCS